MTARNPPMAVTVDVAVLTVHDGRFEVLLVERRQVPHRGEWALPGGFVEPHEDLDEAASRELLEETGLTVERAHLEQLRTYGTPDRDPRRRVVTVAYVAFVPDAAEPSGGSDAADARFWPVEVVPERPGQRGGQGRGGLRLAFDHGLIVADALERARAKIESTTLATSFLPERFTIPDLRAVYQAIWGCRLHASNFRRKVLATDGFVVEVKGESALSGGRPAQLYRRGNADLLLPPLTRQAQ